MITPGSGRRANHANHANHAKRAETICAGYPLAEATPEAS
jgi:hypothetical protein